jgi:hypothetical protein
MLDVLIDFQSHPDGKYEFISVNQDDLIKFMIVKLLEYKRAKEQASKRIYEYMFTLIAILHSYNRIMDAYF